MGRVGRVLVKPLSQFLGLLLRGLQPLPKLPNECQDRRLVRRRYLIPELNRNRRNRRHTSILRPQEGRTSSGRERLPQMNIDRI
jgi:hypothetical protein